MHTNEPKEDKFQNRDIHMTISPIVSKNKQKMLYVMFKEHDKELEICIPSYEVIKNNGFSKEELDKFKKQTTVPGANITELVQWYACEYANRHADKVTPEEEIGAELAFHGDPNGQ